MALRHLLLLCLTTALAFSGCTGSDDPETLESETGTAVGQPLAAGGPAEAEVAALEVQSFALDGDTATGVCAYVGGTEPCAFPLPRSNRITLEADGSLTRLTGSLTWEPLADYRLRVIVLEPDGESWAWQRTPQAGDTDGRIDFDWDIAELGTDRVQIVINSFRVLTPSTVAGGAGTSLPFQFQLEGEVASVAA